MVVFTIPLSLFLYVFEVFHHETFLKLIFPSNMVSVINKSNSVLCEVTFLQCNVSQCLPDVATCTQHSQAVTQLAHVKLEF